MVVVVVAVTVATSSVLSFIRKPLRLCLLPCQIEPAESDLSGDVAARQSLLIVDVVVLFD